MTKTAMPADAVAVGRVAGAFGVKGWIKVQPYTERTDNLLAYPQWWLQDNGGWQARTVAEAAVHGSNLVARLEGCSDRDAAAGSCDRSDDGGLRSSPVC